MTVHWKAYHLNQLIQDSLKNPEQMGQLIRADDDLLDKYQVTAEEREVFRKPTGAGLRKIGVHPILAMVSMIPHDASLRHKLTISPEHLARMKEIF